MTRWIILYSSQTALTLLLPTIVSDANAMLQTIGCKLNAKLKLQFLSQLFLMNCYVFFSDWNVNHRGLLFQEGKLVQIYNVQAPLLIQATRLQILIVAVKDVRISVMEMVPSTLISPKSLLVQVNVDNFIHRIFLSVMLPAPEMKYLFLSYNFKWNFFMKRNVSVFME